ncbi:MULTISPECIES: metallophosphoesterase family protein [unclassified Schlesneria]|uniref:metallophosphoesterase family protein n=1 Tax=unclassified Schlesneria TaxID=2762017 RepID=UPI002EE11F55
MRGRTIAIGDIHGCARALQRLLEQIDLQPDDTLITLGDYVNRGPDSNGVLDCLLTTRKRCHLIPILGNHDEMLLEAVLKGTSIDRFLSKGGDATLRSYGVPLSFDQIPVRHIEFLQGCRSSFETETHFFLHANYRPDLPLNQQDDETIRWRSLRDSIPGPHFSGKIAVLGHTPQPEVLDEGHLLCLDTGCCRGGWLTAMDVTTRQVWQTSQSGEVRH